MYLLIVFLPLLGFFLTGSFGKFLGRQGVNLIIMTFISLSSILSFFIFYEVVLSNSVCIVNLNT